MTDRVMGRKKIGDLETTMQALGMPADLGELHRPSPPATAPDTPSREEIARMIGKAEPSTGGTKAWISRAEAFRVADMILARLAAKPADDGCVHHMLDNDRQVFFYEQDFYVLSNFSAFSLVWEGIRFDTSEAAYHWTKFISFDAFAPQTRVGEAIRSAPSAHEAFKIAERNKSLRRADWDEIKIVVMRDILRAKVSQHEYVRRKLLATGDRELIEDSWRDNFWGWGPNRDGQNVLGNLWMEIREELRALSPKAKP